MGCSGSVEAHEASKNSNEGRAALYAQPPDEADDRQRKLMRPAGSDKRHSDSSSRTSKFLDGPTPSSARDTLPSALVSNLGRSKSGQFSAQGPLSGRSLASPRSPGLARPSMAPAAFRAERRVSIGHFADVPSTDELERRIALAVEKARMQHGIDGSVETMSSRDQKSAAKVGLSVLGSDALHRIRAWCDECSRSESNSTSSPRTHNANAGWHTTQPSLPGQTMVMEDDDDDVGAYMMLSAASAAANNNPTRPAPQELGSHVRLCEDTLRELRESTSAGQPSIGRRATVQAQL